MELIAKADKWLNSIDVYINKSRKRAFVVGALLYTAVFLLFFFISVVPVIRDTGTMMAGDGVAQYYPYLLDLRRNIISFFESLRNGSPQLTMMNFNYSYGADTLTSTAMNFMPMLPFYALSALLQESDIPMFFAVGVMLLSYMSGLSFMAMSAHFKQNLLLSGIIAPFYAFCGNYIFTGLLNPHFLYIYIAFPLMIVSIDRILNRKGSALLSISVGWLALSGFSMLVYTLPFVVVFALIRVWFLYKGEYFRNLLKYFLRGCGAVLLGAAMAGVVLLPCFADFFVSSRSLGVAVGIANMSLWELFIPSADYINDTINGLVVFSPTGVSVVFMPCMLYVLTSRKVNAEVRCCGIVMLLLVALPLIRYGLNGFQYELCRWGFVPALFFCFCCVAYIPKFLRSRGEERGVFLFVLAVYVFLLSLDFEEAAGYFVIVAALINIVPFTKRLTIGAYKLCDRFIDGLKREYKTKKGHFHLLVMSAFVLVMLIAAAIVVKSANYLLLIAAALSVIAVIASVKRCRNIICTLMMVAFIIIGSYQLSTAVISAYIIIPEEITDTLSRIERSENGFGRNTSISRESKSYIDLNGGDRPVDEPYQGRYGEDTHLNGALRFDMADISVFRSTLNGDYMRFLSRCGQDCLSLMSTGQVGEFSGKEILYSLFGAEVLYSNGIESGRYGFDPIASFTTSNEEEFYIYRNRYALPAGVTYDSLIDSDRYEMFSSAELPYAIMDSVYLAGYQDAGVAENDKVYSEKCEFTLTQESRGETSFGIECFDNRIALDGNVEGNFLYLCFDGVRNSTYPSMQSELFTINIGDSRSFETKIHNQTTSWAWGYYTDHYTFALGFCEEDVDSISFVSPFEFESVEVIAVPEEVYLSAYESCTAEILENVELSTNVLTGDISVSSDKILSVNMLYSDGWTAYIDGEKAPIYKANGLFLGIPLSAGEHTVRLEYRTPLLYEGAALSLISISAFVIIIVLSKRRSKKASD